MLTLKFSYLSHHGPETKHSQTKTGPWNTSGQPFMIGF